MSREIVPQAREPDKPRRLSPRRIGAIGLAAASLAFAAYQSYDKSGDVTSYGPIKKGTELIDNEFNVLNWNMHNETSEKYSEIRDIIQKHDVDIATLQEVSAKDAKGLHRQFPTAQVRFAMADAKMKVLEGGFGNVIMSFQEQKDVSAIAIKGNSIPDAAVKTAGGIVIDAINLDASLKKTKDATQEDRSAVASTVQVQNGNKLANVRVITGHVGSPNPELHETQYAAFRKFVEDNIEENQATVMCGDINMNESVVISDYLHSGIYIHDTRRPTGIAGSTLDHCGYRPGGVLDYGEVRVLPNHTDHYALLGSWTASP